MTNISGFWTCWNPCDKDFRILGPARNKDFRIPNFWISRFPDISNLAWVRPGLGLGWPVANCAGAPAACLRARPKPEFRYLGTWKSRSSESHGTLATKISEFWICWNPCVKDFRILDVLEPLCQRLQNSGPTGIHNWFQQVLCTMGWD